MLRKNIYSVNFIKVLTVRIILMLLAGLVMLVSLVVSCVRNCLRVHSASMRTGPQDLLASSQYLVRPDSVLIQQLEEEMLAHFHTDVLMALQVGNTYRVTNPLSVPRPVSR